MSLVTLTALDHKRFKYLLSLFAPLYHSLKPCSQNGLIKSLPVRKGKRGKPRSLNVVQCLGLVLAQTRTKGSETVLSLLFGAATRTSVCSLFSRSGRLLVTRLLCNDADPAVKISLEKETKVYQTAFKPSHSLLMIFVQQQMVSKCVWNKQKIT